MHIFFMYKSKHSCTWDETLPYVQHNYNRSLRILTSHNPFRWGLDLSHWVLLISCSPLHPHRQNHSMLNLRPKKPPKLLNGFITSRNRPRIFYRKSMLSTNSDMINIGCHTCFRWETSSGCICRKIALQDPIKSFIHFSMDLTPSPRLWETMILR
jgi:hypothetical protein